ncbi:MAG: TerD family protein [Cytophagales bacterium]|nr:MAG: TerD family protein [Cytophagales bacterium]
MAINLKKGGSFNLTKEEPKLKKVLIGLGWEPSTNALDLDASVFMTGKNLKLLSDNYFIFYNNLKSPDGSTQHTGDNRTGYGDDDDEMILVNLDLVNPDITQLIVAVSIHEADARKHTFGLLKDAYMRICDVDSKREVARFDLDASYPHDTVVTFGKLEKSNNEWKFLAVGEGSTQGLQSLVDIYA